MGIRRDARELALQILFQNEFSPKDQSATEKKTGLKAFQESFTFSQEVWDYAELLIDGVAQNKTAIDQMISSKSKNWTITRMPLVDVNILRLAIYELCLMPSPPPAKASINEAVEIAKKYGGNDSSQFVNGLLDQFVRKD